MRKWPQVGTIDKDSVSAAVVGLKSLPHSSIGFMHAFGKRKKSRAALPKSLRTAVHYPQRPSMPDQGIVLSQRDQLALAMAQGKSIRGWARENHVPRYTAQRWANDPQLRRQAKVWRQRALDQSLGLIAAHS